MILNPLPWDGDIVTVHYLLIYGDFYGIYRPKGRESASSLWRTTAGGEEGRRDRNIDDVPEIDVMGSGARSWERDEGTPAMGP